MPENILEEKIRKELSRVKHPAIDRSLVELGIVKNITFNGNKTEVTIALPFPHIPILGSLVDSLREPVEKLGGEFKVKLTRMNEEERQAFLAMEEESWKGE